MQSASLANTTLPVAASSRPAPRRSRSDQPFAADVVEPRFHQTDNASRALPVARARRIVRAVAVGPLPPSPAPLQHHPQLPGTLQPQTTPSLATKPSDKRPSQTRVWRSSPTATITSSPSPPILDPQSSLSTASPQLPDSPMPLTVEVPVPQMGPPPLPDWPAERKSPAAASRAAYPALSLPREAASSSALKLPAVAKAVVRPASRAAYPALSLPREAASSSALKLPAVAKAVVRPASNKSPVRLRKARAWKKLPAPEKLASPGKQEETSEILAHVVEDVSSLIHRAEQTRITLRAPAAGRTIRARGVVLAEFGIADIQATLLISKFGPADFDTSVECNGFVANIGLANIPADSLPVTKWYGELCASKPLAERSAALAVLADVKERPALAQHLNSSNNFHCMDIVQGEELEIVIKNKYGWAFCHRSTGCKLEGDSGWVPTAHVVELASVIADHKLEGSLSVGAGDVVEVVLRHYSGWTFCRVWQGVENLESPRSEGWITDDYLEDMSSVASRAWKTRCLLDEALEKFIAAAQELQAAAAQSQYRGADSGFTQTCLDRASLLAEEFVKIDRVVWYQKASKLREGVTAKTTTDFATSNALGLSLAQGSEVVILHISATGWVWCRLEGAEQREGWIPHSVLEVETDVFAQRDQQLCSICLEPLGPEDHTEALPCAHAFHHLCVGVWLALKAECPLCRSPSGPMLQQPQSQATEASAARTAPSQGWLSRMVSALSAERPGTQRHRRHQEQASRQGMTRSPSSPV
eukprot:TRINITY_DN3175_c0_g1_i2.p1 TRINITY_DN3175_c0_g1~~TRINITY_DN3175_c0_g1_i2.p1  ORF type:complete len:760 (-),score=115.07 TRINITY_DN3175_c0_g1_i2:75-2354(-)